MTRPKRPRTTRQSSMSFEPVTKDQIRALHTIRRRVLPDEETYRAMLQDRCGVQSTKDLSKLQAKRLIDELNGNQRRKACPKGLDRRLCITVSQLAMLRDILAQCGIRDEAAARWARRAMAYTDHRERTITNIDQLTKAEARKLIQQARAMYWQYYGVEHDPCQKPKSPKDKYHYPNEEEQS